MCTVDTFILHDLHERGHGCAVVALVHTVSRLIVCCFFLAGDAGMATGQIVPEVVVDSLKREACSCLAGVEGEAGQELPRIARVLCGRGFHGRHFVHMGQAYIFHGCI